MPHARDARKFRSYLGLFKCLMHLPHEMLSHASVCTGGVSQVWTSVELLCSNHAEKLQEWSPKLCNLTNWAALRQDQAKEAFANFLANSEPFWQAFFCWHRGVECWNLTVIICHEDFQRLRKASWMNLCFSSQGFTVSSV